MGLPSTGLPGFAKNVPPIPAYIEIVRPSGICFVIPCPHQLTELAGRSPRLLTLQVDYADNEAANGRRADLSVDHFEVGVGGCGRSQEQRHVSN